MALHQRRDRGDFVNPAGGGPRPKLKMKRGPDGKLEVEPPEDAQPDETVERPGDGEDDDR